MVTVITTHVRAQKFQTMAGIIDENCLNQLRKNTVIRSSVLVIFHYFLNNRTRAAYIKYNSAMCNRISVTKLFCACSESIRLGWISQSKTTIRGSSLSPGFISASFSLGAVTPDAVLYIRFTLTRYGIE